MPDAAVDSAPGQHVLLEDFEDLTRIDFEETTAELDAAAGVARARPGAPIDTDVGDGSGGAHAPAASGVLAPGEHEFASLSLDGVDMTVAGDVVIRVDGPVTLRGGASLRVTGQLTVVVSGPVTIGCSEILVSGQVRLYQPSDAGIEMRCAETGRTARLAVDPEALGQPLEGLGYLDLRSRGGVHLAENAALTSHDGWVNVHAADAVTIEGGSTVSSSAGDFVGMYAGGTLTVAGGARVAGGHDPDNDGIVIRTQGGVDVGQGSLVATGGDLNIVTAKKLSLGDGATLSAVAGQGRAPRLLVTAGDIELTGSARVESRSGPDLAPRVIELGAMNNVSLDSTAVVQGAEGTCAPGGTILLEAGADVIFANDARASGGASIGGAGCDAMAGGDVTVLAGGQVVVPPSPATAVRPGAGMPPGMTTVMPMSSLEVTAYPALDVTRLVESVPLPAASGPSKLISAEVAVRGRGAAIFIAPDGDSFVPAADAVGKTLEEGWRWRLELARGLFDGTEVDSLTIVHGS